MKAATTQLPGLTAPDALTPGLALPCVQYIQPSIGLKSSQARRTGHHPCTTLDLSDTTWLLRLQPGGLSLGLTLDLVQYHHAQRYEQGLLATILVRSYHIQYFERDLAASSPTKRTSSSVWSSIKMLAATGIHQYHATLETGCSHLQDILDKISYIFISSSPSRCLLTDRRPFALSCHYH